MTVEQLVADAHHADALASIAESLRAADEEHVVVGIVSHAGLIGRFEGHAQVLTEVHGEVGQVLHNHTVVFRGQRANDLQLLLSEAHPRGVVGVRIDDGADIAFRQIALQLRTEFLATEVIDIECLVLYALHLQLHLLHRETRVDEQHRILAFGGL